MISVLPNDRSGRLQPNTNGAALVDKSTFDGYAPDDILWSRYRHHQPTLETPTWPAIPAIKRSLIVDVQPWSVIPEIDIWRAAQLMLKRYGDKALEESAARADELEADNDSNGAAVWRLIAAAVGQLANTTPPDRVH